jgi:hypothetical protein
MSELLFRASPCARPTMPRLGKYLKCAMALAAVMALGACGDIVVDRSGPCSPYAPNCSPLESASPPPPNTASIHPSVAPGASTPAPTAQ